MSASVTGGIWRRSEYNFFLLGRPSFGGYVSFREGNHGSPDSSSFDRFFLLPKKNTHLHCTLHGIATQQRRPEPQAQPAWNLGVFVVVMNKFSCKVNQPKNRVNHPTNSVNQTKMRIFGIYHFRNRTILLHPAPLKKVQVATSSHSRKMARTGAVSKLFSGICHIYFDT